MYEMPVDKELFISGVRGEYGEHADEYLALCDFLDDDAAFAEHLRVRSAEILKTGVVAFAEVLAKEGRPVYTYSFDRPLPGEDGGAFHSCELWYQFGTLPRSWRPFEGGDFELSRAMTDYWTNFSKTGNPNGGELPKWSKYTPEDPNIMSLSFDLGMVPFEEPPRIKFRKEWISK